MLTHVACCVLGNMPRKIWLVIVFLVLCTVALHELQLTGICAPLDMYHARTRKTYGLVKTVLQAAIAYFSSNVQ